MVGELRASHVIHLHRLMNAVRADFQDRGMDTNRLGEYGRYDVGPADFKATKTEHERALMALSAALAEWADKRQRADGPETVDAERDRERRPREAGATR